MITHLFTVFLYQPILNLLIFFYNLIPGHDLGIAIILLTLTIRLILYPLSARSVKSQKALQSLQPQLDQIKKKYQGDKEKQSRATMQFYKKNKINPLSSCLPLLIQFPVLIAIYRVLRDGINNPEKLNLLYSFVRNPGSLNASFLGIINLGERNVYLAVLAGAAQFWQSRMLLKSKKNKKAKSGNMGNIASNMSNQMVYLMPIFTVFIAMSFPAGLALYWFATTVFSLFQQWFILKKTKKAKSES